MRKFFVPGILVCFVALTWGEKVGPLPVERPLRVPKSAISVRVSEKKDWGVYNTRWENHSRTWADPCGPIELAKKSNFHGNPMPEFQNTRCPEKIFVDMRMRPHLVGEFDAEKTKTVRKDKTCEDCCYRFFFSGNR